MHPKHNKVSKECIFKVLNALEHATKVQNLFQKLPNVSQRFDHSVIFSAMMWGGMAEIVT
jgi:hypothetical protein